MSLGIIIQARMGATRLPNKMLLPFYNQKGILELLIDNLKSEFQDLPIVLATTTNVKDDALETLALEKGLQVYRGSEHNVLSRFIEAAAYYNIQNIVRVCADNPFLNINALKFLINEAKSNKFDYVSYCTSNNLPTIKTHFGFWAEVVSLKALKKVAVLTSDPLYIEHVTNYIYEHRELFKLNLIAIQKQVEESVIRLTVDTPLDFETAKEVYSLAQDKGINDVLELLEFVKKDPKWMRNMSNQIIENSK